MMISTIISKRKNFKKIARHFQSRKTKGFGKLSERESFVCSRVIIIRILWHGRCKVIVNIERLVIEHSSLKTNEDTASRGL